MNAPRQVPRLAVENKKGQVHLWARLLGWLTTAVSFENNVWCSIRHRNSVACSPRSENKAGRAAVASINEPDRFFSGTL